MTHRKLSEYRAKVLLTSYLGIPYVGWNIVDRRDIDSVEGYESYVLKVDQAVKKRFKNGLVYLDLSKKQLYEAFDQLKERGYAHFIIEPHFSHKKNDERYLSISLTRTGYAVSFSPLGGIDVEENLDSVKQLHVTGRNEAHELTEVTGIEASEWERIFDLFEDNYLSFLEINPYVQLKDRLLILDAAVEVDSAGEYFVDGWSALDFRDGRSSSNNVNEQIVEKLNSSSPASFTLSVLNPNGSIFLLLSGGGASVVIADEIYDRGYGNEIANYGEYSGNPSESETYVYANAVVELLLSSESKQKVLFIGGAVANFTDIANTFSGIIRALQRNAPKLREERVKVFVRRGGPRQEVGLLRMQSALEGLGLLGAVDDHQTPIHEAVGKVIGAVSK